MPYLNQEKHYEWNEEHTRIFQESGLQFRIVNNGESILLREPGKPKVDFYPSTGRWRVAGVKQTYRGGAKAFMAWYQKQTV